MPIIWYDDPWVYNGASALEKTIKKTIDLAAQKLGRLEGQGNLTLHFNDMAVKIGDRHHPAIEYAEAHDMPEVLGGYTLPENVTNTMLQDFAISALLLARTGALSTARYDQLMNTVWTEIKSMNPELETLNLESSPGSPHADNPFYNSIYHAIMGVGDQFNIRDIQHFLSRAHHPDSLLHKWQKKSIEKQTGPMFWRASPHTIKTVKSAIKSKKP